MAASLIDQIEDASPQGQTGHQSAIEGQQYRKIIMWTFVTIVAGSVLAVAGSMAVYGYSQGDRRVMIIWGLIIWISTGVMVAAQLMKDAPTQTRDEVQRIGTVAAQRGYLNIDRFTPAAGVDRTLTSYRLTITGGTFVTIERGEIRMSIDDPQTPPEARQRGDYTAVIQPMRVDPRQQAFGQARFAPLTPEQMVIWQAGNRVMRVFFAGDIWYRDAFEGTPIHHKQFAYFVDIGPGGYREGQLNNPFFARNDEVDE